MNPASLKQLDRLIIADDKKVITLNSDRHGVIYRNIDNIQQKICAGILESVK